MDSFKFLADTNQSQNGVHYLLRPNHKSRCTSFRLNSSVPGDQLAALRVKRCHGLRELGVVDADGASLLEEVAEVGVEAGRHHLLVVGKLGLLLAVLVVRRPGDNDSIEIFWHEIKL